MFIENSNFFVIIVIQLQDSYDDFQKQYNDIVDALT
jgi:hypothetical protein